MYPFNVRVYGLLINEFDQVLLSDEEESGFRFSKFPGGGLEYGEGLIDGLKREFMEELGIEVHAGFVYETLLIENTQDDTWVGMVELVVIRVFPVKTPVVLGPLEAHYMTTWVTKSTALQMSPRFVTPSFHKIAKLLHD